jgi:2Fe-2S ferredoxin
LPKVTFIEFSGEIRPVEADAGITLMQAAMDNMVPGIDADCGGSCACGTCHVIVDPAWSARAGSGDEMEEAMLAMRPDRCPTSRLACQITLTDELDGLVVRLPEHQM